MCSKISHFLGANAQGPTSNKKQHGGSSAKRNSMALAWPNVQAPMSTRNKAKTTSTAEYWTGQMTKLPTRKRCATSKDHTSQHTVNQQGKGEGKAGKVYREYHANTQNFTQECVQGKQQKSEELHILTA